MLPGGAKDMVTAFSLFVDLSATKVEVVKGASRYLTKQDKSGPLEGCL